MLIAQIKKFRTASGLLTVSYNHDSPSLEMEAALSAAPGHPKSITVSTNPETPEAAALLFDKFTNDMARTILEPFQEAYDTEPGLFPLLGLKL
jgi:hypothetical protein